MTLTIRPWLHIVGNRFVHVIHVHHVHVLFLHVHLQHMMAMELSKIWNVPFVETSALKRMNVGFLFTQIVE